MPRRDYVELSMDGEHVTVVIGYIKHTMSKPAFIKLMGQALLVMERFAELEKKT